MGSVQRMPGAFPLHEDRDFLSESEWVIFKLLCRPIDSFADADADELSAASGGQVSRERCDELIRIVQIAALPGLGSWIARLFAEAGLTLAEVRNSDAASLTAAVNDKAGYPICNEATTRALHDLQLQWRGGAA